MKRSFLLISVIISGVSLLFAQLQTVNSYSSSAGAFSRMGFAARGTAMGNAVSSIIDGTIPAYYNPALLPFTTHLNFVASYGFLSLDRSLRAISFAKHVNPNAGFSLFLLNSGVDNIDGRDLNGYHTETLSTSENLFGFSFGIQPSPKFTIGLTMKVLYYSLYHSVSSTTVGIDVGGIYLISDALSIGFVLQDINSKYKWDTSKLYGEEGKSYIDRFPLRKRVSLTYLPKWFQGYLTAEMEYIGKEPLCRVGAEIIPQENISLRAGIDEIMLNKGFDPKPAFGIAFRTILLDTKTEFQYSYCIERYSPNNIHILTLYLQFL